MNGLKHLMALEEIVNLIMKYLIRWIALLKMDLKTELIMPMLIAMINIILVEKLEMVFMLILI